MKYFIVTLVLYLILIMIKSRSALHMLQQNEYNENNRYIKWIESNFNKVFLNFDLILFIFIIVAHFIVNPKYNSIILWVLLFILIIRYIFDYIKNKKRVKKPLVYTSRIKRLIITILILYLLPFIIFICNFDMDVVNIYDILFILYIYFSYFVVFIGNFINKYTLEKIVYLYYFRKTVNKLNTFKDLKVIGITGSYGKTSSKNILNDILSIKFNTVPTPKNWNTPYGLMKTIGGYIDKFDDIFIAEMGAYQVGDIKRLCKLVKPKYGIITKIGTAHLESMGSEENIRKCKFELLESLPSDGVCILNKDDIKQATYNYNGKAKIIWIGIENKDADFVASNIKIDKDGMSFDCKIGGKKVAFRTNLLGIPNIYNILAGIALGNYFGITNDQLVSAVKKVKPVEHRLELKNNGDITYIDDAYSSNPEGAKMAIEVLSLMNGKKIIMTPGMIELGQKQEYYNKEFGKQIAKVCDIVILVGKKQTKPIYDGLVESNYKKENIHVIDDVKKGFEIINKVKDNNTFVLLENDLPDLFNE